MENAGNSTPATGTAAPATATKPKKKYTGQQRVIAQPTAYDFGSKKLDGGKGAKVAVTFLLESGDHSGEIFSWFGVLNEENDEQFNRCVDSLVNCGATDALDTDADGKLIGFGSKKPTLTMGNVKGPKGDVEYGILFVNGGTPMANALSASESKSLIGGLAGKLADRAAARRSGRGGSYGSDNSGGNGDTQLIDEETGEVIPI